MCEVLCVLRLMLHAMHMYHIIMNHSMNYEPCHHARVHVANMHARYVHMRAHKLWLEYKKQFPHVAAVLFEPPLQNLSSTWY